MEKVPKLGIPVIIILVILIIVMVKSFVQIRSGEAGVLYKLIRRGFTFYCTLE
jgi:regulator of protease activity HflC (stomatin/prohibitin superfamily)